MKAISVTTSASQIVQPSGKRNWLIVQNNSDTDWAIALSSDSVAALTVDNGLVLRAGDLMTLSGPFAKLGVAAIHGGSGSKDGRIQGGRVS